MTKTVRQELVKIYSGFLQAVRDEGAKEIHLDVEDFEFPETLEHEGHEYRKKWVNNRRAYVKVG